MLGFPSPTWSASPGGPSDMGDIGEIKYPRRIKISTEQQLLTDSKKRELISSMRRIEAFEMGMFWRMFSISWTAREIRMFFLDRMGRERELFTRVKRRKTACFRHVLRNEKISAALFNYKGQNREKTKPR